MIIKDLKHEVEQHVSIITDQLIKMCHINSGSENLDGLKQMSKELTTLFQPIADEIQIIKSEPVEQMDMHGNLLKISCGDTLYIRKRPDCPRRILLTGHMDTVFSKDSTFQEVKTIDDNRWNGPGVADMKGGLLVILHALSQFEKFESADSIGWDVMINADEEIGSIASSRFMDEIARHYQASLIYEPAMNDRGSLAKNRKGSGKLTIVAKGRTAHAGRDFYNGRNAIVHLAEILADIHQLNFPANGVTINIGKILGGDALNQVPDKAVAKLDIRIAQQDDEAWVRQKIDDIIQKHAKEDYQVTVHGQFARPVKRVNHATENLFNRIVAIGKQIGVSIDWMDSGGCCDGNNIASHGVPVIDTLGVRGGAIHSPNEYILLDSFIERITLSTLLLDDLARGSLEDIQS
jgi:glutamate carboxypeptidase